jgi:hypothetical protein
VRSLLLAALLLLSSPALAMRVGSAAATQHALEPRASSIERDRAAGGTHWRLETPLGAVHVWQPPGFRPSGAATVVYLHGYYTDTDQAWDEHELALQFRRSGRNAIFIVAESPISNPDRVRWPDPAPLLDLAALATGAPVPCEQLVVVAHSGGFRTVVPWLSSPLLNEVILLDGLYNNLPDFERWLKEPPSGPQRRLVLVGFETAERSEQLLAAFPDAVRRDSIPESLAEVRREERDARLLFMRSQLGHMELVTEGWAIPMLLKLGDIEPL